MRTVFNLNATWAFSKEVTSLPAQFPAEWEQVNLPHSWNAIDGQDGGNDYFRGTGYYAKNLSKADLPQADRYYLEIRGANSSADVYIGGKHMAHHDGGYSTWRVDITNELSEDNLLVIAVDNSPSDRVYPQMADFTFYGGLYRDVNIVCVNESHFDLDYYGTPGIKVTPVVDGTAANVEVEVFITNPTANQSICYQIQDAEGNTVAIKDSADTKVSFRIENVHKWHGRKDPYLYTAKALLVSGDNVLDSVTTRFGCRSYVIDPENGFILNGEEYPLRGVSRHQDRLGIGNALLPEHHKEDMDLICEVGATTIRLAHYQHDQYFYDLCDERGMVIWAEIPYISSHMPAGRENTISQMKELIIQNYNHPSIVVWGLSNEISINGATPDLIENHHILNNMCHEMDATRPTTMAVVSMCSMDSEYVRIPDTVSYNHYFGWYGGEVEDNGPWLDKFHAMHPDKCLGVSEYGAENILSWHSAEPENHDYTEEYANHYHQEMLKTFAARPYLWATHQWNCFDFAADARNEGGVQGRNNKGLITYDRKTKKDAFYLYKAWWNPEPMVFVSGGRFVNRAPEERNVIVYTNCETVTLVVNGVDVATKKAVDHMITFENVALNDGENTVTAYAGEIKANTIKVCGVAEHDYSYDLPDGNQGVNWFDDPELVAMKKAFKYPKDAFSIKDKMGALMDHPETAKILGGLMQSFMSGNSLMGSMGEISPEMMSFMRNMRLSDALKMAGDAVPMKMKLDLNLALNQIKK